MPTNSMDAQLQKILANMKAYEQRVHQAVSETLEAHAEKVKEDARSQAPVDTGELRDSIEVVKTDELHYQVVADAPHALEVELGTASQPAQPFLFPAFEASRNDLLQELAKAIKKA